MRAPLSHLSMAQAEAARQNVREHEVRLDEARVMLKRRQQLRDDGLTTAVELDQAQAEVDSLAARIGAAQQQVRVAESQAAVQRVDLENTIIRAPFSGVAITKDAQPGEMVSPVSAGGGFTRTGISTIVDMRSLEIEVDVNESYINRVRPAQKVSAVLDAYPELADPGARDHDGADGRSAEGDGAGPHRVRRVGRPAHPAGHGRQGHVPARCRGLGVACRATCLAHPEGAVRSENDRSYVFLVRAGHGRAPRGPDRRG